jgi:hypothetical protein
MRITTNSISCNHHSSSTTTSITDGRSTALRSSIITGTNRSQQRPAALPVVRTLRGTAQAA